MAILWLRYGCVRWVNHKRIACLLLLPLLSRPRENKLICSSRTSSSLLASPLTPCLPWIRRTVRTVRNGKTVIIPGTGLPRQLSGKERIHLLGRKCGFDPWVGKIPGSSAPMNHMTAEFPGFLFPHISQTCCWRSQGPRNVKEHRNTTPSRICAWKISQTEGNGGVQSMGLQKSRA